MQHDFNIEEDLRCVLICCILSNFYLYFKFDFVFLLRENLMTSLNTESMLATSDLNSMFNMQIIRWESGIGSSALDV